jgi:5'-nucleotidase
MRRLSVFLALAALAACQPVHEVGPRAADAPLRLKLIAFNDFHGYLDPPGTPTRWPDPADPERVHELPTGGAPQLAGLIGQLRARNPRSTVVAAGDLVGGSPLLSAVLRHEPSIEALNAMGLEFSSVGNHEFDRGPAELLRLQNGGCHASGEGTCVDGRFGGARFRYLAANVRDRVTGASLFPGWARKRFELGAGRHVDVAFIGLVLKSTPSLVSGPGMGALEFGDEAAAANALVPEIRAQGIETLVVLIHEGGRTTAPRFDDADCPGFSGPLLDIVTRLDPAIDVVVSGHTHRAYVCRYAGRLVTSAGNEGRFVTDIDLTVDARSGDVLASEARQLAVINDGSNPLPQRYPPVAPDPRVTALVEHWRERIAPLARRVVGRVERSLTRRADVNGETALGEVIADAQLRETRDPARGGARIAFVNNGGLRADLNARPGGVTYDEVFAVHPFGNVLVTLTLTGAQIHALLEQQWQGAGSLLQVSEGFSYTWQASAPAGRRVDFARIRLDGQPLDPAATYRVTLTDFLAGGGDGYTVLRQGTDPLTGPLDVDLLERLLAERSPLAPPVGGRVTRLP